MVKWAYQVYFISSAYVITDWMNKWGEQGWEVFQVSKWHRGHDGEWGRSVFMKRPSGPTDIDGRL